MSQQVDWWTVHEFVTPQLNQVERYPMAGTIAWQLLSDTDPAKWAALLDAAQHHILRVDMAQEARAQASKDVAAAADWPRIAREIRQRNEVYIPRRAS
ncbi:DUF2742 domain-containing protein [Mycolicibacterium novocastrense]|nr:DUF2742 domain-containing protein [Mycolicibacterium novocastrense]